MKNKISYAAPLVVVVLSSAFFLMSFGSTITSGKLEGKDLSFAVTLKKNTFTLGEPIQVEFVLRNTGSEPVKVPGQGVESGSLKIFIAGETGDYKEYFGSGWGRRMGTATTLHPGKTQSYYATILWNGKPNVSHLNERAAEQVLAGKITTEYALPDPGVYFIKGVSSISSTPGEGVFEPIRVVIDEPKGDDLEVWNKIKGDREIAYLLQKAAFDTGKEERKQELIAKVEQILVLHPYSVYSTYLGPNLKKYKEDEAKRNRTFNK